MNVSRSQSRLKLFDPDNHVADRPKMKRVRLKQIVRVLFDAAKSDRTWLSDFAEDEIRISADLYEVLGYVESGLEGEIRSHAHAIETALGAQPPAERGHCRS